MSSTGHHHLAGVMRRTAAVWLALLVLLALTCSAAYLDLGAGRLAVGLGIALAKVMLVGWFFMKVGQSGTLLRAVLTLALVTLALLFALSGADLLVRAWAPARFQAPQQIEPLLALPAPRHAR